MPSPERLKALTKFPSPPHPLTREIQQVNPTAVHSQQQEDFSLLILLDPTFQAVKMKFMTPYCLRRKVSCSEFALMKLKL